MSARRDLWLLTCGWALGLLASGIAPYDRLTWLLEVFPALLALPLLWATVGRFQFSTLVYGLILVQGLILMAGGAYTYARVPLGYWLQDWLHLSRNPYDKAGHLAQGFVPALIARELLIRKFHLPRGLLLAFLAIAVCGSISALYEIFEWQAAVWLGQGADEFLGTQGDPWDTQSDMLFAFIGAVAAMLFMRRAHDVSMSHIKDAAAG